MDLEISLNMTRYWPSIAKTIKDVGSPAMFQFPMHKLGEAVFDRTIKYFDSDSNEIDTETSTMKTKMFLAKLNQFLGQKLRLNSEKFYHTISKDMLLPLPICNGHCGQVSGFHCIFSALKDRKCRLQRFYLNRCLLNRQAEYLCCLGDAILENKTLTQVKIDNILPISSDSDEELKIQFTLPLFMGLCSNSTITDLDFSGFENAVIENISFKIICEALSHNTTLKILNFSGWKFNLDLDQDLEKSAKKFLEKTNIAELVLAECEINFKMADHLWIGIDIPKLYFFMKTTQLLNQSIQILNLDSTVIQVNNLPLRKSFAKKIDERYYNLFHNLNICK